MNVDSGKKGLVSSLFSREEFKAYREGFWRSMFNLNHDFPCITLKAMCTEKYPITYFGGNLV